MSVGYLLTVLVVSLGTALALFPPLRPRPLAQLGHFVGVAVNEVPQVLAVLLGGSTLLAVAEDDLPPGPAGTGVLAAVLLLTGAGMVALGVRGVRDAPAVDRALADAGIPVPPRAPGWWWRPLLLPLPVRPRSVERLAGIPYGAHRRQRVDVYRRRDLAGGAPVLVYLHGGGYYSGGRHRAGRALLHHLAARGWVCVSAGYRLRPGADFEDHLADARSAIEWVRRHAAEHGGDPDTVVMAGSSAGAHLATLCALDPDPRVRPDAAVGLYGYYGRYYGRGPDEPVASSPLALPAAGAPPTLLVHGRLDPWTPVEAARALARHLREGSSRPAVLAELPSAQHGFDLFRSWRVTAVVAGVSAFLTAVGVGPEPAQREEATWRS